MPRKKKEEKQTENNNPGQIDLFSSPAEEKKNNITNEQYEFINFDQKKSVILSATAGSGKTYSCVERLKKLIDDGVDPSRIIFFSFTNAATDELRERVGNDEIEIRTIHSFCAKVLTRLRKGKAIATFYDFIKWFNNNYKPPKSASFEEKQEFDEQIDNLYTEYQKYESKISAYKLQKADNIPCAAPDFWSLYRRFQYETKSRDFADMLIEVRNLFKEDRYLKLFKNKYDYIFIDEYQDTSSIQMDTLLKLNAKYYYLVGDRFQSLYGFSGSNCDRVEAMLKEKRKTTELHLTQNFRSDINIVDNSNKYSSLKAIPTSQQPGYINKNIIRSINDLEDILKEPGEVVVLVRTNAIIRQLEIQLLKKQFPLNYFNYISKKELEEYKKGKMKERTKRKFDSVISYFDNSYNSLYAFMKANENSNKFITSIHKSKGREFDTCVVVNSLGPDILEEHNPRLSESLTEKQWDMVSFDINAEDEENQEKRNIHYVAVSRPKHKLFYMMFGI